jgi:hypothetical protein
VLELVFKPVMIKPMLPEWTFAVHCSMVMLVLLGQSTIETVVLLNQIGSNTFVMVGLHMRPGA